MMDFHTHIKNVEDLYPDVTSVICGSFPEECAWLNSLKLPRNYLSFGLHPWYAEKYSFEEMEPFLHAAKIIGEIGLDNIWCSVPMKKQKSILQLQLALAKQKGCPIILHTKGMELEIAHLIKNINVCKIIHWYSCHNYIEEYIKQDAYFTVGPDIWENQLVQEVVKKVPISRLLLETDGLAALEWVLKRSCSADDIPFVLENSINYLELAKRMSTEEIKNHITENENRIISLI